MRPKRGRVATLRPMVNTVDTRTTRPGPKVADPYYSTPEHKAWREEVIWRAGGRCEWVENGVVCGRKEPRMFADHIHEIKDGGDPQGPGMLLCGRCHTLKTARARAQRTSEPTV